MDPRLEKLMKEIVNFLKEDLDEENLSYECQLKKDFLIKKIILLSSELLITNDCFPRLSSS